MDKNCTIHISISYPAVFTEVLTQDAESTEIAIENGIHQLLIELFGEGVIVKDVVVQSAISEKYSLSHRDIIHE